MSSNELRKRFLEFFEKRGHMIVPSSSLLPDDPSVLLTTAGMQQFKPYYTGAADPLVSPHPTLGGKPLGSKNAVSIQKSFRTSDIDEVGDERHLTFFEMLGNFSFGGYWKKEAIQYAYDFITKELGLKIDYVSVFGGENEVPADEESEGIWKALDKNLAVKKFGRADNFWGPTGKEGPCGPTTEIYIDSIEVWNIVFNQYYQKEDGSLEPLKILGIDTGMGLERLAMVSQKKENLFETDLFDFMMNQFPARMQVREKRIFADHIRAVAFLISDGIRPSNKEQGYVLRRLLRRLIVLQNLINAYHAVSESEVKVDLATGIFEMTKLFSDLVDYYEKLDKNTILLVVNEERAKFGTALKSGIRELDRIDFIDASQAFHLFESYGLPYEVIKEVGGDKAKNLNREDFDKEFAKHQEISRAGAVKKFGGHGLLLDTGELKAANEEELKIVTKLHTATHLLQAALRKVLGNSVHQAGSDITTERTRFDFTFERKLTAEEIKKVEDLVNEAVAQDLIMEYKEIPFKEAVESGALYSPKEKYPAIVKVYTVYNPKTGEVFSKELCGGPHVAHTGEIGPVKITKEEGVSALARRIRASLLA